MAGKQVAGWGAAPTTTGGPRELGDADSNRNVAEGNRDVTVRQAAQAEASQPHDPLLDARARLDEVERLHRQGKLDQAAHLCQTILRRHPEYFSALHRYGVILAEQEKYAEAVLPLVNAVMLDPRAWSALTALSTVYLRLGALDIAAQTIKQALQQRPDEPAALTVLAKICVQNADYEAGADVCRQALSTSPSTGALVGLSHCLESLGEFTNAAVVLEEAVRREPNSLECLYMLSQLPHSRSIDLLPLIDNAMGPPSEDRSLFEARRAITRAAALDRIGRCAEAWDALIEGNRRLAVRYRDSASIDRRDREALLATLKTSPGQPQPPVLLRDSQPISLFILGASRSGKTTIERLVGTVTGVKRGYENPILRNSIRRAFQAAGLPTRDSMIDLPADLEAVWRRFYVEELKERAKSAKVFTNTKPTDVAGALRIAKIVPNFRFVLVKRDRYDMSLKILLKIYERGNFYAYDLDTIRDYLAWYDSMIDLVAERLPTISRVVHYEQTIADPAGTRRVIAELCGLPEPSGAIPELGDDRGCAQPYRAWMEAAWAS